MYLKIKADGLHHVYIVFFVCRFMIGAVFAQCYIIFSCLLGYGKLQGYNLLSAQSRDPVDLIALHPCLLAAPLVLVRLFVLFGSLLLLVSCPRLTSEDRLVDADNLAGCILPP